jgi:hypothetical protein
MNTQFWNRLQTIDRRVIYAVLIVVILVPLFFPITLPTYPSKQSQDFYDTIQKVAADKTNANKIVIINGMWSPSTRGENQWQAEALVTHLMMRHLHFAILSFDTQNNTVMQTLVVDPLARKYGYVYGRDYVNWGYRPIAVYVPTIKGLVTDIPGTIKKDYKGVPIASLPVMQGIKSRADVAAVVDITPVTSTETWLGLFEQNNQPPFLFAPTAVMAPTYYPYLDTGQIAGMLTGIKGAGDYEGLLGTHSFGTRAAGALSLVYALIILLIILGNVGYYATRAAARKGSEN